jgi:hypothetical protein
VEHYIKEKNKEVGSDYLQTNLDVDRIECKREFVKMKSDTYITTNMMHVAPPPPRAYRVTNCLNMSERERERERERHKLSQIQDR